VSYYQDLLTSDLQQGYGVSIVPGQPSPAATNPERFRRKRTFV